MFEEFDFWYGEGTLTRDENLILDRDNLHGVMDSGVHPAPVGHETPYIVVTKFGTINAGSEDEAVQIWDRYLRTRSFLDA